MLSPRLSGIMRPIGLVVMAAATIGVGAGGVRAADRPSRVPWTTSRIAGAAEPPPPYTVEPAFPHLKFKFPVVLVPAPGTNRFFVGELPGRIVSFPDDPKSRKTDLALDVAKLHPDLTAFYGIAFHPRFEENRD